jgi:hypothetical protein
MTTRQEKRIIWNRLITQLEQLETQHRAIDGQLSCGKCDICKKIRNIGRQLSTSEEESSNRNRSTTMNLSEKLSVAEYWKFKDDRVSDEAICKMKKVSSRTMCEWKRENEIFYRLPMAGVSKRGYASRGKKTKGDVL